MKIGIDARLINETGVGRYIRNLIEQLQTQDLVNRYVVYLPEKSFTPFHLPSSRWEKRLATARWHTLKEQFAMPRLYEEDHLDLLHVPYFNIPIFYPGKYVVTIHDITILHVMTGKATTLPYPFYFLKKIGFRFILTIGLQKAQSIIVPSQSTKEEIIRHFHIPEKKVHVTYEGIDSSFMETKKKINNQDLKSITPKQPYFLYVGNAYPHKNLELLLDAFEEFMKKGNMEKSFKLVFVGKDDIFYSRLKLIVKNRHGDSSVLFYGHVSDELLKVLYKNARALVIPSLMEGFGLPALEAAVLGTTVVCSDIPVFHEILGDIPIYIHPNDKDDIVRGMSAAATKDGNSVMKIDDIRKFLIKKYSWKQLGKDTIHLYNQAAHSVS